MAFFRACDGQRICLVLPRDTLVKIALYAAQENLEWDLAMNDLLTFGLDGEDIHLGAQAKPAPPAASVTQLGPQEPPDDPMIYNRRQADGTFRSLAGFWEREAAPPADGEEESHETSP